MTSMDCFLTVRYDSRLVERLSLLGALVITATCVQTNEDVVFAPGGAIESNLKNLAERRSDIFGVGQRRLSRKLKIWLVFALW